MAEQDKNTRLSRLLGGLGGLATAESEILPGLLIQNPMAALSEIGERVYPEIAHGQRLAVVDPAFWMDVRKMRKHLGAPSVPIRVAPMTYFEPPFEESWLARRFSEIGLRERSYAGAAHELGHSVPSAVRTMRMWGYNPIAKLLGVLGGVGTSVLADDPEIEALGPAIAAAPHLTGLAEEARASTHGVRAVRAIKGNKAALEAIGRLLPAFLTYVGAAAPAVAAPIVATALKKHISAKKKKKQEEKTAAKDPKPPKATGRKILSARQEWSHPAPKPTVSKVGKPGTPPAKPPSKSRFYKDMLSMMSGKGTRKTS